MNHRDHVNLLRPAGIRAGGVWADLGAGSGAFTLALRELAGPQTRIYAVDKDRSALGELQRRYRKLFGSDGDLVTIHADFSKDLNLPRLDGVVMANSLHFFREKQPLLERVREALRPAGQLLLVEYNAERGNPWVPHPLRFEAFRSLAPRAGFSEPWLLGRLPSSFLEEIYSAAAHRADGLPSSA